MTTPDHDDSKPRRRWHWYAAAGLSLLLVAYPLSIGPACVFVSRCELQRPAIRRLETAYTPVSFAIDALDAHEIYVVYIEAWFRVTGTPLEK